MLSRICLLLLAVLLLLPAAASAEGIIATGDSAEQIAAKSPEAILLSDQSVLLPDRSYLPRDRDNLLLERNDVIRPLVSELNQADDQLYWHHQNNQNPSADINTPLAWSYTFGAGQIVAVIDSGVNSTLSEFEGRMWSNKLEKDNGVDDDGNGIIDDIHGAQFTTGEISGNSEDQFGHGTQVASVIAANANSGGVVGVAPAAQIMSVRIMNGRGEGTEASLVAGINYAMQQGAKIINLSLVSDSSLPSPALSAIIAEASKQGVLVVIAAGNKGQDIDKQPVYPAALPGDNIVSVGSSNRFDKRASFSNYGQTNVDLYAPGESITTLGQNGRIYISSGTSLSAPITAAGAALVRSRGANLSPEQIRNILLQNVDRRAALSGQAVSGGRLNVGKAINQISKIKVASIYQPPGKVVKIKRGKVTLRVKINSAKVLHSFYLDGKMVKRITPKRTGDLTIKLKTKKGRHLFSVYTGSSLSTRLNFSAK